MQQDNIKVSVLTPIYNHSLIYVRQCLDSLKAQTLQEIEFILIDNGAPDDAKQLIEEYKNLDERFRILHIEKNQGYAYAINLGLEAAKGEYIGLVESDDWIEPEMYEDLYNIADTYDLNLVKSVYYENNKNAQKLCAVYPQHIMNKKISINEVPEFLNTHAAPWSFLYKKDLLDNFRIRLKVKNFSYGNDLGLVIKSYIAAQSIYITDKAYYHYNTFNPNQSMAYQNGNLLIDSTLEEFNDINEWFEANNIDKKLYSFIDKRLFFTLKNIIHLKKVSKKYLKFTAQELKKIKNTNYFSEKELNLLNKIIKNPIDYYNKQHNKITIKDIFTIKRTKDKSHNIFNIFGIKFKFKIKKNNFDKLKHLNEKLYDMQKSNIEAAVIHPSIFSRYKNLYNNSDLVIVGCGPSASFYTPFDNAIHIGVNRAYQLPQLELDYLFVQDLMDEEDMYAADNYLPNKCQKFYALISESREKQVFPKIKRIPLYHVIAANAHQYILKSDIHWRFPFDLTYTPLSDIGGTALTAMQFALFTNPKRIYLVGCDCSIGHFHAEAQNGHGADLSGIKEAWIKLNKYLLNYNYKTEIIVINPVGLKGMFKDVYTQSYVDAHQELLNEDILILNNKNEINEKTVEGEKEYV